MWTSREAGATWQTPHPRHRAARCPYAVPGWLHDTGRNLALLTLAPWQVLALHTVLARHQLVAEVLPPARPPTSVGTARSPLYCIVAAGTRSAVRTAQRLWASGESDELATAANMPPCCVHAAADDRRTAWHDRTWPTATRTVDAGPAGDVPASLTLPAIPQTSTFLAPLGLRAVQHHPCRTNCPDSRHDGNAFLAALGACHPAASRQLAEMLSWPLEWSARHGIAEIRTPILKLAHHTDPTSHTLRIAVMSPDYPEEGATGLRFPYRTPRRQLPIASVR